jgi:hypothetical protein
MTSDEAFYKRFIAHNTAKTAVSHNLLYDPNGSFGLSSLFRAQLPYVAIFV